MRQKIAVNSDGSFKQKKGKRSKQWNEMYTNTDEMQFDKWYNATKDFTFNSKILKLSLDEAKGIKFMCEYYYMYKKAKILNLQQKRDKGIILNYDIGKLKESIQNGEYIYEFGERFDWKGVDKTYESTRNHLNVMLSFEKKINDIMKEIGCQSGDQIFIKLHTHSPKDATVDACQAYRYLYDELKEWDKINRNNGNDRGNGLILEDNQVCQSFYRSSVKCMGINNGEEAIELLCRSYEKIFTDISLCMLKQDENDLNIYLIIR